MTLAVVECDEELGEAKDGDARSGGRPPRVRFKVALLAS
jgi:hypothetical protein